MSISSFIVENLEDILTEWDSHVRDLPGAKGLDAQTLRDQGREILLAIAADMRTLQSEREQQEKSQGRSLHGHRASPTSAGQHGIGRHLSGFSLIEVVGEYRALRASVVRLWMSKQQRAVDESTLYAFTRFHEAVDQQLIESLIEIEDSKQSP